jgi:nuclear pore complex protein Nup98-Nup96
VAPYQATTVMEPPKEEGKPDPPNQTPHSFQSICCMPQYANYSFEVRSLSSQVLDELG